MGGSRDGEDQNGSYQESLQDSLTSRNREVRIMYRSAGTERPTSTTDLRDSYIVSGISDIRDRMRVSTSNRVRDRMYLDFKAGHTSSSFVSGYQARNRGASHLRNEGSSTMQRYNYEFGRCNPRSERTTYKFLPNTESHFMEWVDERSVRSDVRPIVTDGAAYSDSSQAEIDYTDPNPTYSVPLYTAEQFHTRQRGARVHPRSTGAEENKAMIPSREPYDCVGSAHSPVPHTATDIGLISTPAQPQYNDAESTPSCDQQEFSENVSIPDIQVEPVYMESATPSPEPSLVSTVSAPTNIPSESTKADSTPNHIEPISDNKSHNGTAPTPSNSRSVLPGSDPRSKTVRFDVTPSKSISTDDESTVDSTASSYKATSVGKESPEPGMHLSTIEVDSNESLMPSLYSDDGSEKSAPVPIETTPDPLKRTSVSKEPPPVPAKPTKVGNDSTPVSEHPVSDIEESLPNDMESKAGNIDSTTKSPGPTSISQEETTKTTTTDKDSTPLHVEPTSDSKGSTSSHMEQKSGDTDQTPTTKKLTKSAKSEPNSDQMQSHSERHDRDKSPPVSKELALDSGKPLSNANEEPTHSKPETDTEHSKSTSGPSAQSEPGLRSVCELAMADALKPRSAYIGTYDECFCDYEKGDNPDEGGKCIVQTVCKRPATFIPRNTTPTTTTTKAVITTDQENTDGHQSRTDGQQSRTDGQQSHTDKQQSRTDGEQSLTDGEQSLTDGEQSQHAPGVGSVEPSRTDSSLFCDDVWDLVPTPCSGPFALLMLQVDVGADTEYNTVYEKTFDYWTQDWDQIEQNFVAKARIIDTVSITSEEGGVSLDLSSTVIGSTESISDMMAETSNKDSDPLFPDKAADTHSRDTDDRSKHTDSTSLASVDQTQKQPEKEASLAADNVSTIDEVSDPLKEDAPLAADDKLEKGMSSGQQTPPTHESKANTTARRADDKDTITVNLPGMDRTDSETSKDSGKMGKDGKKRKLSLPFWFKRQPRKKKDVKPKN